MQGEGSPLTLFLLAGLELLPERLDQQGPQGQGWANQSCVTLGKSLALSEPCLWPGQNEN